jgi:glycosyltransferase involved in cell wall biosynthesis
LRRKLDIQHLRIGFISTRFEGTDGVSLETAKWALVFEEMGHTCFYFAGKCDRPDEVSYVVPEAFFHHPEMDELHDLLFSRATRPVEVTERIHRLKEHFKQHLYAFVSRFDIDLLIIENALSIPVHVPLGMAITELIAETGYPTIGHHHDMAWERQRFQVNSVNDYLAMAFPPNLASIRHVVINSVAASQLALRTGISSLVIPNVMDFDHPPAAPDTYTTSVRADLGVLPGEKFILQPTRVVQRKGIEHAIELVSRLEMPARLVISHAAGDEGRAYEKRVRSYAARMGVPALFVADLIQQERALLADGRKVYTLDDIYPYADLVTYPSEIEGFGNAFLEAVFFHRPIVVNTYSIYEIDIKPKGFAAIEFDGFVTDECVDQVREVLNDGVRVQEMAEMNYHIARRHYSYSILQYHFRALLTELFGI